MKQMNLQAAPKSKPTEITLYHGSLVREFTPTYGRGKDKHDYGRGFYLTPDIELAKEWAVGDNDVRDGWLHTYTLNLSGLRIFDFESLTKNRALCWATEILKHREPNDSYAPFYEKYRDFLFQNFSCPTEEYDVVCGWRADDAYFGIVNYLLSDTLSLSLLEDALRLGGLGIQYCCKSKLAFSQLTEQCSAVSVPNAIYGKQYRARDKAARAAFTKLRRSERNEPRNGNVFMRDIYFGRR